MDVKCVEFGIIPLFLFGTAAYPLLSRAFVDSSEQFERAAREFVRIVIFCGGWLAVAVGYVVPLIVVPIFGIRFRAAVGYLPWFAALALLKGAEAALYRLTYAAGHTRVYTRAIIIGAMVILLLNPVLMPALGVAGAAIATVVSVGAVVCSCAWSLRAFLPVTAVLGTGLRTGLALVATVLIAHATRPIIARPWLVAVIACAAYPVVGAALGLVPHPARSSLLRPGDGGVPGTQIRFHPE